VFTSATVTLFVVAKRGREILDRLVHRAYKIIFTGESMRKHAARLTDDPARA
jgi:DNA replication protein DnaC